MNYKEYKDVFFNIKNVYIIIILLILLYLIILNKKKNKIEKLDTTITNVSNEALQNIASVYANTNSVSAFNNLKIGGTVDISNNLTVSGNITCNNINAKNLKGIIVLWSGLEKDIPIGWILCDGTNGTPDLRGRFILSSGQGIGLTKRNIGDIGGSETHILSIDEMPTHQHNFGRDFWSSDIGQNRGVDLGNVNNQRANDWSGETSYTGGNKAHNNMPPFYVLAYIMKI
jgi:microcystin-dependent protein